MTFTKRWVEDLYCNKDKLICLCTHNEPFSSINAYYTHFLSDTHKYFIKEKYKQYRLPVYNYHKIQNIELKEENELLRERIENLNQQLINYDCMYIRERSNTL